MTNEKKKKLFYFFKLKKRSSIRWQQWVELSVNIIKRVVKGMNVRWKILCLSCSREGNSIFFFCKKVNVLSCVNEKIFTLLKIYKRIYIFFFLFISFNVNIGLIFIIPSRESLNYFQTLIYFKQCEYIIKYSWRN